MKYCNVRTHTCKNLLACNVFYTHVQYMYMCMSILLRNVQHILHTCILLLIADFVTSVCTVYAPVEY